MNLSRRMPNSLVVVAILSLCLLFAWHFIPGVQVTYHRWRMDYWHDQGFSPGVDASSYVSIAIFTATGDNYDRYADHRQQLVRLGFLAYRDYRFPHWKVSPKTAAVCEALSKKNIPEHVDCFRSVFGQQLQLEVFCRPIDAPAWDEFVRSHYSSDAR